MANSFTASTSKVYGSIDSTGSSNAITVTGGRLVDLSLDFDTSSFIGTVKLQRATSTGTAGADAWQTIASYTASTEISFRSATTRQYRLTCSAVTSGTLKFELTAGNKVY